MPTHEQHKTAAEDRVPWGQLIAYGMGGLIPIALFNIAGQLMGLLGNISLGLSAVMLGAIMFVPRLWDAFSDPVVGHLSDNTRTRWGRRRPYILIGGIAVALSFVAMWWIPRGEWIRDVFPSAVAYDWFQLLFILAGLLVFFTACTVFEIPHGALGMEMSTDYHERTRLFSAKSFLGNLFAMGTPALYLLAGLTVFSGPGGNHIDGMRYVSMLIAVILVPMTIWWFFALKEPGFAAAKEQQKSSFWPDLWTTAENKTFLNLTLIIFTLGMGFNFVSNLGNYIVIFYLYGGDTTSNAAGWLMFVNGLVWAITGLVAVFPLNWLSRRIGKNKTLLASILLMCAAQFSKVVCYDPQLPYLMLVPTILLSAGMLMFFTLGASMVGDVCDEDELNTGARSEGTYYSVFWWFIKLGTAIAILVAGLLLVFTQFDQKQNVTVDALGSSVALIKSDAELWLAGKVESADRIVQFNRHLEKTVSSAEGVREHFDDRIESHPDQSKHVHELVERLRGIHAQVDAIRTNSKKYLADPATLVADADAILADTPLLKQQAPITLYRLRLLDIGLPLALSVVSIWLTLRYPLTEARCYEIKAELKRRRAAAKS